MAKKSTEDYLKEGIYGVKKPKQAERNRYLGTLRERIVLAFTIGQVMQQKGLPQLEEAMKQYPDAHLLLNGQISSVYFRKVKALASRLGISYTSVANEEVETDIGAVLAVGQAIELEQIFIEEQQEEPRSQTLETDQATGILGKIKGWFSEK